MERLSRESVQTQSVQKANRRLARRGFIVLSVLVVATLYLVTNSGRQPAPPQTQNASQKATPVSVSSRVVKPSAAPLFIDVPGVVQSELEAPVGSKVVARVQKTLVHEGDFVRRGQTLITLEANDLEAAVSQAVATLRASSVGYDSARVSARMEDALSPARIAEAQSKVAQSEAALQATLARLELVQAGARHQEKEQASLAVAQANANFTLAESDLKRMTSLFEQGAISAQQHDQYLARREVAKAQLSAAQEGRSVAYEGSRAEEIRAAQQAVRQAQATVQEARAGLKSAQASALMTEVRRQEIQGALAQVGQSQANLRLAQTTKEYSVIVAPFDGVVRKRMADPGAMASPGVPLITIQGGEMRLEALAPESVIGYARLGAAIPVTLESPSPRVLAGRIAVVAPQGDANSHTFTIKITLPLNARASAGMFGRARFAIGTEKRLLVPSSAILEREGLRYLYVIDESHVARLRMATFGDPVGDQTPVLSGLNPGERIVAIGKEKLTDGATVVEEAR